MFCKFSFGAFRNQDALIFAKFKRQTWEENLVKTKNFKDFHKFRVVQQVNLSSQRS